MKSRHAVTLAVALQLPLTGTAIAQAAKNQKAGVSTADAIIAQEQSIFDALTKNDIAAFNKAVGGDFVFQSPDGTITWELAKSAEILKPCTSGKFTMTEPKVTPVAPDVMVLTYTIASNQVCNGQKSPSPTFAMSVWQKRGGRWVVAAHSQTPAAAPTAPAKK